MEEKKQENIPYLQKLYLDEILPKLKDKFGYKNNAQCPRLLKISLNVGAGEAKEDAKILEKIKRDISLITGQVPRVTKARKAISNFKLREGMAIGCAVTLRKKMMYEFLERFISIACPRIKDFRGFSLKAFDKQGNYTLGISEHTIFPEINLDKVEKTFGMDITFVTSTKSDREAKELLRMFGFPFRR